MSLLRAMIVKVIKLVCILAVEILLHFVTPLDSRGSVGTYFVYRFNSFGKNKLYTIFLLWQLFCIAPLIKRIRKTI